ncbi:LemA family protein [Marinobacter sp. LN3S78]|uniref:LemA family protein n=1 Tax=Marinobacter sp. LN3S78 TaxID=3382300 RepID=UPI00387B3F20
MERNRSRDLKPIIMLVLAIVIVAGLLWSYNQLISKEEAVDSSWAQLESNYQRRHDLIPSLVATVSRYLEHEQETLQGVVEGRAQQANANVSRILEAVNSASTTAEEATATSASEAPKNEETLRRIARAQAQLSVQSRHLMAVVENYPQLHSSDQFLTLQAQIEGAENRINVARMRYNDAVEAYNAAIRRIPGNLWASLGQLQRKAYFEADEEAEDAVTPVFD